MELRTGMKLDQCGKCGGNGSSCSQSSSPVHGWEQHQISSCSVSCGGGLAMVQYNCVNTVTNTLVNNDLCDAKIKPKELFADCNTNKCPPR